MEGKNIVHFLKADSGDCFLIQLADKNCILIDGGYKSTFQSELKPLLKELSNQNYRVALFIVTHFDEDHIGGAITFIEENGDSNNPNIIPVDNIWFNGIFQLIMRDKKMLNHLVEQLSEAQKDVYQILADQLSGLIGVGSGKISATQAEAFETLCVENHYKMNAGGINGQVINGASLQIGDCIIRCLNPDDMQLNRLSRWIDKKCIDCLGNDYELDKNGFIAFLQRILIVTGKEIPQCTGVWKIASDIPNIDDWVNTSSLAPMNEVNRSSIVVEVKYKDIRMLFMGDSESKDWVAKVIQSNKIAQSCLPSAEASFLRIYGSFHEETEKYLYRDLSWGKFREIKKIKDILPIIHWGRLPIFDKNLLFNRELDPETQTLEFYDHPDCLRALLYDIRNQGIVLSNDSDQTLNRDMYFDVYTRRWGHNDRYIVTRTVDGWYCKHLAINGRCEKDGNGGLFANLRHDSVFFPQEGVEHALCELWEAADDGEIDFAELSKRLQEVADWISVVEKAIYAQPKWVNYY